MSLRCDFSPEELQAKGAELSATSLRYDEVEETKKTVTAQYREELSDIRGEMRRLSKQIRIGGEDRPVECLAKFHVPNVGEKTIIRLDTGELVKVEPMTDDERQETLFEEVDALEALYRLEVAQKDVEEAKRAADEVPPPEDGTEIDSEGEGSGQ